MGEHNILEMLNQGLQVTVNSDDPPYFGGYLMDNFAALEEHLELTKEQATQLVRNSITASFLGDEQKRKQLASIDELTLDL